jgi:hypothetical protein
MSGVRVGVALAAVLGLLVVSGAGAVAAGPSVAGGKAVPAQSGTRLTLCGIYLGRPGEKCSSNGGISAPVNARYRLVARAFPQLRYGDSIRIRGIQTDPVSGNLGVLRECFATPCTVVVSAPRRGGIVAADYWAFLVRGGVPAPKIKTNVVRYVWRTISLTGTWRGQDGSTYTIVQAGTTVTWNAHAADGSSWCHTFVGKITGYVVEGDFTDSPKCGIQQKGHIRLQVVDGNHMKLTYSSVGFGTQSWERQ